MLYSVVFVLRPPEGTVLPSTTGEYTNAVFYSILHECHPDLFRTIHDGPSPKPFTVSPLFGRFRERQDRRPSVAALSGEDPAWFRVCILDDTVFLPFLSAAKSMALDGRSIRIDNRHMLLEAVHVLPGSHPFARFDGYEELLASGYGHRRVLRFLTPTTFTTGEDHVSYPLPDPRLVFRSLLLRWKSHGPPVFSDAEGEDLLRSVRVTRYTIRTHAHKFSAFTKVGFVGEVEFTIGTRKPQLLRLFNTLASFAFYAGVGAKTTMGMGQAVPADFPGASDDRVSG